MPRKHSDKNVAIPLRQVRSILSFSFLFCLAASMRFFASLQTYSHPDEIISEKVVNNMIESGSLDTNWAGLDLPSSFNYAQFNFSGYHIFLSVLFRLMHLFTGGSEVSISEIRTLSGVFWLLSLAATTLICSKLFGTPLGFVGGTLFAVNPLLFQDSLYARPEAYVVFMSLLCFGVLALNRGNNPVVLVIASVILGNLIATKISILPFALVLLASGLLVSQNPQTFFPLSIRRMVYTTSTIVAGLLIGFFISVPHIIVDPGGYINGVQTLSQQYTTGSWPHGLQESGSFGRLSYALNYFFPTIGVGFFVLAIFGLVRAVKGKSYVLAFLGLMIMLLAILFSQYAAFFERNFSHLIALTVFFVVYSLSWVQTRLLSKPTGSLFRFFLSLSTIFAIALPAAHTTFTLLTQALTGNHESRVAEIRGQLADLHNSDLFYVRYFEDQINLLAKDDHGCLPELVEVTDYGDAWTEGNIELIQRTLHYSIIEKVPSLWEGISTSTLHTYFSPGLFMVRSPTVPSTCVVIGD